MTTAAVTVEFPLDPPVQGRWSGLFRGLICLPLAIVVSLQILAAFAVSLYGAVFALATRRVPKPAHDFLVDVLRRIAVANGYASLALPRWPGLLLAPSRTPEVVVSAPYEELRRRSVLFRSVLAIPAVLLVYFLTIGLKVLRQVARLFILFKRVTPVAMHQTIATITRLQVRYAAYIFLVTPEQPWHGIFGDEDDTPRLTPSWKISRGAKILIVTTLLMGIVVVGGSVGLVERTYAHNVARAREQSLALGRCEITLADWVIKLDNNLMTHTVDTSLSTLPEHVSAKEASEIAKFVRSHQQSFINTYMNHGAGPASWELVTAARYECLALQRENVNILAVPHHP